MTDSVGVRATARQFPVSVSAVDDGKALRQERATYFAAVLGSTELTSNAKLVAHAFLRREGRGGWPRWLVAMTEDEIARMVGMPKETASRAIKRLKEIGWCTAEYFRARTTLPNGEVTPNGSNVYTLHPERILELGPEHVRAPERPTTNVVRPEFARLQRQLEDERSARLALERQVAQLVAAVKSAPPPPPVVAEAPAGGTAADSREPSEKNPGGPVRRTLPDDRRLRSNVFGFDPSVGIASPPPMGSPTIPPLSLQGSQGERETKPHTAGAREPKTPTPGVCAIVDTKPHEILKHWAARMGVEWERADYATQGRLAIVRGFLRSRPSVTLQAACDAIDGGWLKPASFYGARWLETIFSDKHFDAMAREGRVSREEADRREKQRNRDLEIEELEVGKSAQVVPLPVEEFAKIQALRGAR